MHAFILRAWRQKNAFFYFVLIPLSWLFSLLTSLRRWSYRTGLLSSEKLSAPVIIVGNINMGGSGKTPVVIWLADQLKKAGYYPGVISRGYGVKNAQPAPVQPNSIAIEVGDEPLLIARRAHCPVWVGINRVEAGRALLRANPECNVIISDDGLQHYALQRDIEIVVADEHTAAGQKLLPAGPLREPVSRLQTVDAVINNGQKAIIAAYEMQLSSEQLYNLADTTKQVAATYFQNKEVVALAGIGKPERFFDYLRGLGISFESLSFQDHHVFTAEELDNIQCDALIMTEKDAVKCEAFAKAHYWVLPVKANMNAELLPFLLGKLKVVQYERNDTK